MLCLLHQKLSAKTVTHFELQTHLSPPTSSSTVAKTGAQKEPRSSRTSQWTHPNLTASIGFFFLLLLLPSTPLTTNCSLSLSLATGDTVSVPSTEWLKLTRAGQTAEQVSEDSSRRDENRGGRTCQCERRGEEKEEKKRRRGEAEGWWLVVVAGRRSSRFPAAAETRRRRAEPSKPLPTAKAAAGSSFRALALFTRNSHSSRCRYSVASLGIHQLPSKIFSQCSSRRILTFQAIDSKNIQC